MEEEGAAPIGIPAQPATTTDLNVPGVNFSLGKTRTFAGLHWKEWAFLIISGINLLATGALTIYRLVVIVRDKQEDSPDFTFAILILLNAGPVLIAILAEYNADENILVVGFCLFYAFHGVLREISYDLYALIAAIVVMVVYCILEYSINASGRNEIKLARLVAAAVLAPVNIALAILVTREFGWLEFRIVGASETLQYIYEESVRFLCLLRFDFQVSASIVVLVLRNGTQITTFEIIILAVGLPYCLLWAILGWLAMRFEQRWMIWMFAVLGLAESAYVIYKIYRFSEDLNDSGRTALNYSTLAACIISALVHISVYVMTYQVSKNFGKGLKERVFPAQVNERTGLLAATEGRRRQLPFS